MSYYKGMWQKFLVWLLILSIFLMIFGGMSDATTWKMWFILPFSVFFIYLCGKYRQHTKPNQITVFQMLCSMMMFHSFLNQLHMITGEMPQKTLIEDRNENQINQSVRKLSFHNKVKIKTFFHFFEANQFNIMRHKFFDKKTKK